MREITGTFNRVLEVDLSKKEFNIIAISEIDRNMFLGGKGLGLKLLYDRLEPGIAPLGKDNIMVFMMGVLMGTGAPCSGRFCAVTKSPLTGIIATASCGGPFGMALKTSGWDGLIIRGKARNRVYLYIDSEGVKFKSAGSLWGKDTFKTQEILEKEGKGALVIGPAGENGVAFANICSGRRYLGRGGMGAVMGSKNLKAIVAKGSEYKILPADPEMFKKVKSKFIKYINSNKITSKSYRSFGTNANVNLSNASGILPVRNFTGGMHDEAYKISGEVVAESYNTKHETCKPCSILCGHRGEFDGKERIVPEYETMGLFGSNLEIFDPVVISEWNEICGRMGMDTISAGSTIAWTMEAAEKGLIKTKLKFGSPAGVSKMLKDIALLKGTGKHLARGARALAEKYGGMEFAIHVKGLEMAAYDPRGAYGQGLSYAVANRGACHLSSAVFATETFLDMANPLTPRNKPYMVKFFEDLFCSINSLHICSFTAYSVFLEPPHIKFSPNPVLKFLTQNVTRVALASMDISLWPGLWSSTMGKKLTVREFKKTGERIHALERYMNTLEGISRQDDTLPERLLKEGRRCDPEGNVVPLDKMLDEYYRLRGFDSNGIPGDDTLKKLGIVKK